jgi:glycosyltransferase involved in cell wall biosynthesis
MADEKKIKALFWRTEFYGAMTGGGVAAMHRGQLDALHRLGHSAVYATSGKTQLPDYVKTYYIPYSRLFWNLPEVLTLPHVSRSTKVLLKIIEKEQPDFLFQHHHDFTIGGTLVKEKTGLPFLLHCDFIQQWTKKHWGKLYMEKLLKWGEEIQWEAADKIFTISNVAKQMMVEQYGADESKIIINPNGVNTTFFKHNETARQEIRRRFGIEDKFVQGFSGTFGVYHGVEVLAESVRHTLARVPDAVFLFVGDGELKPKVEEIIKQDNMQNRVIFTGMVPYSEVPGYLSACDVLHTPCVNNADSSEYFGSPTKLFEYMAMNKPIVASDVGQQGDILITRHNALLIPERQPEAIAEAIETLRKEPELAVSIAKQAHRDAVEKWDWVNNVQRIIDAAAGV